MFVRHLALALFCSTASAQTTLYRYIDASSPGVGWSVRGLGDLDGNGSREVAVLSFDIDCGFAGCMPNASQIAVLSGPDGALLYSIPAPLNTDAAAAIDVLEDINGDGVPELLVGAPYAGGAALFNPVGALRIHSGANGALLQNIDGPSPHSYLGTSVAGLDDFDGDGLADVAGALWNEVRVYSSASGQELFAIPSPAVSPYQCVVERFDDFDLDGRDDFLVGFADLDAQGNGVVQVRSGASGALLTSFNSPTIEPTFGWDVRNVGDVNGDGRADVMIGAPQLDVGSGGGLGVAFVFAHDGTMLHQFSGTTAGTNFGWAVAGDGDLDGDGVMDFAVASSCDFASTNCQRQTIVFSGANGSTLATVDSPLTGFAGVSVDFVGDLDGDQRSEVAFGSSCSEAFVTCGIVTVFGLPAGDTYCTSGTSSSGCSAALSTAGTPSVSASSGFSISAAGLDALRQGLVFYGVNGREAFPWGATSSFLCVKSPLQRTAPQNSGGTAGQCDGAITIDWLAYIAANPNALGTPFQPGDVVNAQAWYRDPPSSKTTALSNAVEFTLEP